MNADSQKQPLQHLLTMTGLTGSLLWQVWSWKVVHSMLTGVSLAVMMLCNIALSFFDVCYLL